MNNRVLVVVALLVLAVVGAVVFGALWGGSSSERAVPESAQVDPPAVTPVATVVPAEIGGPPDRPCAALTGDYDKSDTTFVDLNADGLTEVIALEGPVGELGGVLSYAVLTPEGECGWNAIGVMLDGPGHDLTNTPTTYRWACSHSRATQSIRLVQTEVRTSYWPMTVQQSELRSGRLYKHRPTISAKVTDVPDRQTSCDGSLAAAERTQQFSTCGGLHWEVPVPDGWKTVATGDESCSWFVQQVMTLPCQCNMVPPISISLVPTAIPIRNITNGTVVDEYPAVIIEDLDLLGGSGERVNRRSYYVDIGTETLVLAATNQDSDVPWDELVETVDQLAFTIQIIGRQVPTTDRFNREFPDLQPRPMYVDPRGVFAWYGSGHRSQLCDKSLGSPLVRLQVATSRPGSLDLYVSGDFTIDGSGEIQVGPDGTATLRTTCLRDGKHEVRSQLFEFDPFGYVTKVYPVGGGDLPQKAEPYAVSPNGRFRYATGDDPLERIERGCSPFNTQVAQTLLLRYVGTSIVPALRDGTLTGTVENIRIIADPVSGSGGTGDIIVWESLFCKSTRLFAGRLDVDGYIVDRHAVLPAFQTDEWAVTDDGELILLTPKTVTADDHLARDQQNGVPFSLPWIEKVDLLTSGGWVMTADLVPVMSAPIAPSLDGGSDWYLGENRAVAPDTGWRTIYQDHPDGYRRVIDHHHDIEGDVVSVLTSPTIDGVRAVVALVSCDSTDGFAVWFASETSDSDGVRFSPSSIGPVAEITDLVATPEWLGPIDVVAIGLDGIATEVRLEPGQVVAGCS